MKTMKTMNITINFDMDGTIADLYANPNWLPLLRAYDPTPYATAKPLLRLCDLARKLNALQKNGYRIAVISWLSKESNAEYDKAVTNAKLEWLAKHLPSVNWDEITIVPYGTPKQMVVEFATGILFDDEKPNRTNWTGTAYDVENILEILKGLI